MTWACELTEDAERDLLDLPRDVQRRVAHALDRVAVNPFQGDLKALKGPEWRGVLRRRVGSYRILFTADHSRQLVSVLRILRRSEKTYR
jgi:mRNA-degrading endonuclease RelE of RelBE toxin-antitoxin system